MELKKLENQERAFKAASRRKDRSLEDRVASARKASEVHYQRTGKHLIITEESVLRDGLEYDEVLPNKGERELLFRLGHMSRESYCQAKGIPLEAFDAAASRELDDRLQKERAIDEQFAQVYGRHVPAAAMFRTYTRQHQIPLHEQARHPRSHSLAGLETLQTTGPWMDAQASQWETSAGPASAVLGTNGWVASPHHHHNLDPSSWTPQSHASGSSSRTGSAVSTATSSATTPPSLCDSAAADVPPFTGNFVPTAPVLASPPYTPQHHFALPLQRSASEEIGDGESAPITAVPALPPLFIDSPFGLDVTATTSATAPGTVSPQDLCRLGSVEPVTMSASASAEEYWDESRFLNL